MAGNRVVIKINYDADKRKEVIDPKLVTVWHTKRITVASGLLILTIAILFWFVSSDDRITVDEAQPIEAAIPHATQLPSPSAESPVEKSPLEVPVKQLSIVKGEAIIFNKRVIRASLNTSMKDDEPGQPLSSALSVTSGRSQELFYFSETRRVADGPLFHLWLKDGRAVQKKPVDKQKTKFTSKYLIGLKDLGQWQVQLIDKKGRVYCQAGFDVAN